MHDNDVPDLCQAIGVRVAANLVSMPPRFLRTFMSALSI
jgi:hypothetical protein